MGRAVNNYWKRTFFVDQLDWYAIQTPKTATPACNYWAIKADKDLLLRTDPDDENTQDRLPAGSQEGLILETSPSLVGARRYLPEATVIWVRSVGGVAVVIATFSV